jgi:WD40 repeat protein
MTLGGREDASYAVAFSPDGQKLAAAYSDGSAALWDLATESRTMIALSGSEVGP